MVRVAIILILFFLAPSLAWADGRFALVIGNRAYTDKVGPLKNPHKDIAVVGKALETDQLFSREDLARCLRISATSSASRRLCSSRRSSLFKSSRLPGRLRYAGDREHRLSIPLSATQSQSGGLLSDLSARFGCTSASSLGSVSDARSPTTSSRTPFAPLEFPTRLGSRQLN
jgi:hypothetical protein